MLSDHARFAPAVPVDLSPYLRVSPVIVAVSGGSDSTALMTLAAEARHDGRLVAVTVDHALRPESAEEAESVASLAAHLGIEHRTIVWRGDKPRNGIQAQARAARLTLLGEVASGAGARIVLTGHTLDDQAETVLMRSARGDGIGLAGIAPATLYGGRIWFVRPLLNQRRAELREMLNSRGIGWVDDPSNQNEAFERVRVRAELAGNAGLFERTIAAAKEAAAERKRLAESAAVLLDRHARLANAAALQVDAEILSAEDQAAALHAFRLLLAIAGAGDHLPDRERSASLFQALRSGSPGGELAHARVARIGDVLQFSRDKRGRAGPSARFRSSYDALLPSFDWAAAAAIARLLGRSDALPAIPAT